MTLIPCHDLLTPVSEVLALGNAALDRGDWEAARDSFAAALDHRETPEGLEGLATASWHLEDGATAIDARQRAYQLYLRQGDAVSAARLATLLAWDHVTFRYQPTVSSGWIRRAHRLLEGQGLAREHCWLAVQEGAQALLIDHDPATADRLGSQATDWGRALGSVDLEALGAALSGLALISQAKVDAGMSQLDEAGGAIAAGELSDLTAIGLASCYLIFACCRMGDYERAVQWCQQLSELSARWRLRALSAVCRTHEAEVLMWQGDWDGAEAALVLAVEELAGSRPGLVCEATATLGELRRRQGRFAEAGALFRETEGHPTAQLGQAAMALDERDVHRALECAERFLAGLAPEERVLRARGIETLVAAQVAAGRVEGTPDALAELRATARAVGTGPLLGAASRAEGIWAAERGHLDAALAYFEDAIDLYQGSGGAFETARARLAAAETLLMLSQAAPARTQVAAAAESLAKLGARHEGKRAAALLGRLEANDGNGALVPDSTPLTRREVVVLNLVAQGLTTREAAERLGVSVHTVHRHIANIRLKLAVSNKTAAVTEAVRRKLL